MKILFLHGYAQSGPSFSAKTKSVQKALKNAFGAQTIHFDILSAPHSIRLSDVTTPASTAADSTDSAAVLLSAGERVEDDSFGWWHRRGSQSADSLARYVGLDDTLSFLSHHLNTHGPFDGVIGFSQGAACAALLASMLERPGAPQEFKTGHGPFKFAVCCGGFRLSVQYEHWYTPKIRTPILHIIGSLDAVVETELSLRLARCCEKGEDRVVYHPGGHYFPGTKDVVGSLVGFVRSCCEERSVEEDCGSGRGSRLGEGAASFL